MIGVRPLPIENLAFQAQKRLPWNCPFHGSLPIHPKRCSQPPVIYACRCPRRVVLIIKYGDGVAAILKLPLDTMLLMLVGVGSGSLSKELYDWFEFSADMSSASAFVQQRNIKTMEIYYLGRVMNVPCVRSIVPTAAGKRAEIWLYSSSHSSRQPPFSRIEWQ